MQNVWQSVKIWQSYREYKGGNFFETQCIHTVVVAVYSIAWGAVCPYHLQQSGSGRVHAANGRTSLLCRTIDWSLTSLSLVLAVQLVRFVGAVNLAIDARAGNFASRRTASACFSQVSSQCFAGVHLHVTLLSWFHLCQQRVNKSIHVTRNTFCGAWYLYHSWNSNSLLI